MYSTLLWYFDYGANGDGEGAVEEQPKTAYLGKTAVEYTEQNGVRYSKRIISTDLRSYLDPRLSPGSDITGLVK
ncbi:MAG: YlzJ-like family protein [Oscillospiraceae bacterium]|jgi:hypothetical protein|nr:YlzJ-like family protein [Oscillospiraceae bacterium]